MTTKKTTTKKAASKKSAKKAVKKVTKKKINKKKKTLVCADGPSAFWMRNGVVLDSLITLKDALAEMEKEVYQYHVSKEQNDFAEWVESVLADSDCAYDLKKAKTSKSATTVVVRHLKTYTQ